MAGRDDGEFELILGNKQLLSVLFIVIVLLGVFFAMGFLAGRSTGGSVVAKKDGEQIPISVDAATNRSAEPQSPAPVAESTPPQRSAAESAPPQAENPPAAATKPATEPEKKAPAPEPKAPPAKPAPTPPAKPAAPASTFVQTPPAGTYLQVAAVKRAEADAMLAFITEKTKLKGFVTPVPKSTELCRVVLGPFNSEEMAAARSMLGEIGVKSPYPVKY
ncbi:MAG: SPOR domain-containing protein [Acidobacteria bacterium]|nr:SPOR domain-containing protein [Acidobacteriota bacterium]